MGLNCKPGDLAVIVKDDFPQNIGKLVTVLERANPMHYFGGKPEDVCWSCMPSVPVWLWASDDKTKVEIACEECSFDDWQLKPLRDSDGTDEMIRIAGLPNKEPSNV